MLSIVDILQGAANLIHQLIRKEHSAQGHNLTGEAERSLEARVTQSARIDTLTGYGIYYLKILDQGLAPDQVGPKMIPGLIRYFVLRGLPVEEAKNAARATLATWKKEGMSTQASKRFSSTGGRQHFIEAAFLNPEIDAYVVNAYDHNIEEQYRKTKSEVI